MQADTLDSDAAGPTQQAAWLACVLLVGFLLRWWHLERQCLSHDEVIEVQSIQRPFREFFWAPDGFPPLHRVCLWIGARVTSSDVAGRWIALASGMATLIALYGCGTLVAGRQTGLATAAWAAISPLLIYYSQESRAYGLYLMAAAFAIWVFFYALKTDSVRGWSGVVVVCLIGECTHYYFGLLLLLFGVIWIADRCRSGQWWRGSMAFFSLGLLQLVLYPMLREDLRGTIGYPEQTSFGLLPFGYTLYSFLAGYCLGPSQAALHEMGSQQAILGFLPYMIAVGVCAFPVGIGVRELHRGGWTAPLLLLGIGPILLVGTLAWALNLNYSVRYVVFASIPFLIFLGRGWAQLTQPVLKVLTLGGMTALCVCGLYHRNYVLEYQNEDVRAAAELIQRESEPTGATVLVNIGYMKRPLVYYLGADWDVRRIPEADNPNGLFGNPADVDRGISQIENANAGDVWVVLSRTFHGDAQDLLRDRLEQDDHFEHVADYAGVVVHRYQP